MFEPTPSGDGFQINHPADLSLRKISRHCFRLVFGKKPSESELAVKQSTDIPHFNVCPLCLLASFVTLEYSHIVSWHFSYKQQHQRSIHDTLKSMSLITGNNTHLMYLCSIIKTVSYWTRLTTDSKASGNLRAAASCQLYSPVPILTAFGLCIQLYQNKTSDTRFGTGNPVASRFVPPLVFFFSWAPPIKTSTSPSSWRVIFFFLLLGLHGGPITPWRWHETLMAR